MEKKKNEKKWKENLEKELMENFLFFFEFKFSSGLRKKINK